MTIFSRIYKIVLSSFLSIICLSSIAIASLSGFNHEFVSYSCDNNCIIRLPDASVLANNFGHLQVADFLKETGMCKLLAGQEKYYSAVHCDIEEACAFYFDFMDQICSMNEELAEVESKIKEFIAIVKGAICESGNEPNVFAGLDAIKSQISNLGDISQSIKVLNVPKQLIGKRLLYLDFKVGDLKLELEKLNNMSDMNHQLNIDPYTVLLNRQKKSETAEQKIAIVKRIEYLDRQQQILTGNLHNKELDSQRYIHINQKRKKMNQQILTVISSFDKLCTKQMLAPLGVKILKEVEMHLVNLRWDIKQLVSSIDCDAEKLDDIKDTFTKHRPQMFSAIVKDATFVSLR